MSSFAVVDGTLTVRTSYVTGYNDYMEAAERRETPPPPITTYPAVEYNKGLEEAQQDYIRGVRGYYDQYGLFRQTTPDTDN